jgi:Flp pilus assembly protein TadG
MKRQAQHARLLQDRHGAAAIEFALVVSLFLMICFGLLLVGTVIWTQTTLQNSASLAARCAALNSPDCPNVAQYAVNTVANWTFPGMISTANVSVTTNATSCGKANGKFAIVTVSSSFWNSETTRLLGMRGVLTATACFPQSS